MKYANEQTEAIVLSAILNGRNQYIDQLTDDDITVGSYRTILQTCRKLYEAGQEVDIVTVGAELMNRTGYGTLLAQISAEYFQGIHYDKYVDMLKSYTAKRKIHQGLHYIQEQLKLDNPADIKSNVIDYFSEIPLAGQAQDDSMKSVMLKTNEHLEYKYKHRNDTSNHTGIADLDKFTGGLHKGEVTIIAARPSVGKTALAVQIALQVAKKGKAVQIFSREMSQVQLGTRLIANLGKIDGQRMRTGHIRDEDWISIVHTQGELSSLPLYINDESSTMPDIRAVCAEKKHKGLDLVIIDYMQLIEPHKRSDTREREVAEISRAIKKLTLELEIPIIALSQLNRSTANKRPTLDTLRESGAIEQDADNVILLHKPDEKDVPDEDLSLYRTLKSAGRDYVEVIIGKQRNGPTGMFTMSYNPRHMEFIGIERERENI
jgi:replicative DNA helicase